MILARKLLQNPLVATIVALALVRLASTILDNAERRQ